MSLTVADIIRKLDVSAVKVAKVFDSHLQELIHSRLARVTAVGMLCSILKITEKCHIPTGYHGRRHRGGDGGTCPSWFEIPGGMSPQKSRFFKEKFRNFC